MHPAGARDELLDLVEDRVLLAGPREGVDAGQLDEPRIRDPSARSRPLSIGSMGSSVRCRTRVGTRIEGSRSIRSTSLIFRISAIPAPAPWVNAISERTASSESGRSRSDGSASRT